MPCLAFVNSWFTAPPYIRSRCFARGSEVVFYYIYFFFDFKFNTMSNTMSDKNSVNFTRREFLGTVAAAAAFTIVPRSVLGGPGYTAPSDMVNLAGIGVGSQGGGDIQNIATPDVPIKRRSFGGGGMLMQPYAGIQPPRRERRASDNPVQMGDAEKQSFKHANIYALCDVDHDYSGHILAGYPKAKKYTDFREMIDKEKEIDAVLIGTPDHTHAVIAAYAMKAGKHVFVEKPMAKTIYETRFLRDLAKQTGVVTQMGNQGHNIEGTMQTVEWIQGGVIGDVREVHLWTNRPMWAKVILIVRREWIYRLILTMTYGWDRPLINLIIRRCFISLGVDYGITVQALWGIWELIPSTLRFGRLIWVCPRKYKLLPPLTIRTICHNRNA